MTTLIEQIETMRIRMNAMATEEYGLFRTLDDQHLIDEEPMAAPYDGQRCDPFFEPGSAAWDHFALEAIAGRNHDTQSRLGWFAEALSRMCSAVSALAGAPRQE